MSGNEKDQNDNNLCNKHASRCDKDHRAVCPSKLSKSELEDLYYTLLNNNLELKRTVNAQNEKNRILSTKVQRMTAQTKMYGGSGKDCCASAKAIINEQKATVLLKLPKHCSASGMFAQAQTDDFFTIRRKRIASLLNRVCSSSNSMLRILTERLDCPLTKYWVNMVIGRAKIADLKRSNEAMADRIRKLSTQLCTAKQFLKQNPNSRPCYKCYVNATTAKNQSSTSLHNKTTEACSVLKSVAASAIFPDREPPATTRTTETNTPGNVEEHDEKETEKVCIENRCRSTVEDLKRKIADLEEELAKTHTEYSGRMSQLETEVHVLQTCAAHARRENTARTRDDVLGLSRRLKDAAADKAELEAQLSFEKKRVVELGMLLKAAELSQKVAKAMEGHITTAKRLEEKQLRHNSEDRCSYCSAFVLNPSPRPISTKESPMKRPVKLVVPDKRQAKSDDSGYADCCRDPASDDMVSDKVNEWLIKKIAEMQEHLDNLKLSSADTLNARRGTPRCTTSSFNAEKWCDESECKYPVIAPETPQTSTCCDPKHVPTKVGCNNETCEIMTSDHDRNCYDSDTCPGNDEKRKLDDSSKEGASCSDVNEEGHDLNLSKQSRERFSFSMSEQEVELKSNHTNKIVDEVLNTKSEVPQELLDCEKVDPESEDIKPETPLENNKDESNTTDPFISHQPEPSTIKQDDHESHKILLPSPVHSASVSKQNKTGSSNWKKAKLHGKKKGINVVEDNKKNEEIVKTPADKKQEYVIGSTVKKNQNKRNNKGKKVVNSDSENLTRTYDVKNLRKSKDSVIQSKHVSKKRNQSREGKEMLDDKKTEDRIVIETGDGKNKTSQLDKNAKMRRNSKAHEFGSVLKYPPVGTSTPNAVRSPSPPHTYTVDTKSSRATSPDNTDNEISGMTDLPTEKDAATPRDILSPGEHRTTATSTESCSFYNDVTLSEGEVPAGKYSIRRMSKSVGEVRSMDQAKEDHSIGERRSSADKMEDALLAVSQELARCRSLLQRPRAREKRQSINVSTSFNLHKDSIILRKSKAKSSVETSCLFILHISTILLANEVIKSSEAHLMLTWKFLNLSTVTHMGIGPVIDIGFTARYKIQVNKNSINYFKNEDMPIMVCEEGDDEKPLATCTLPLHHLLVQANRRVDLSLPLRAGPRLRENTTNENPKDDVGVVDLWCMLSCESRHLDSITQNTGEYQNDEEPSLRRDTPTEGTAARRKSQPELRLQAESQPT